MDSVPVRNSYQKKNFFLSFSRCQWSEHLFIEYVFSFWTRIAIFVWISKSHLLKFLGVFHFCSSNQFIKATHSSSVINPFCEFLISCSARSVLGQGFCEAWCLPQRFSLSNDYLCLTFWFLICASLQMLCCKMQLTVVVFQ